MLEQGTVFLAEGPFANKSDAVLQTEGEIPLIALMAILAGL